MIGGLIAHSAGLRRRYGQTVVRGPTASPRTLVATLVIVSAAQQAPPRAASAVTTAAVLSAYDKLPAAFVENRGQLDDEVRYYAQGRRYAFYLTRDRASRFLIPPLKPA